MRALLPLALLAALGCSGEAAPPAPGAPAASPASPGSTDVAGLKAALDAGDAVVVDVRTPDEWASGHVPGALHIPLDDLEGRLSELSAHRGQPVHLICASGGRSSRAAALLARQGFAQPVNVEGGTRAWVAAGYPVE